MLLTRESEPLDEAVEEAMKGTAGERLVQVLEADDGDGGMIRPFVVIDLRSALRTLRRGDTTVPGIDQAADAASELTSESRMETQRSRQDGGRGLVSSLFVAGVVLGIGYALRKRSGSMDADEATEETAERTAREAETLAERAATTIQQRGEVAATRIEESTEAIAERIEERGQEAAENIEQGGQEAAQSVDEASDRIDDMESQAEEKAQDAQEDAEETVDEMGDENER